LDWGPNIIEFALDERYLGVHLYPRQATLLKLLFCSPALFTDYDRGVLAEWTAGFSSRDRDDGTSAYVGSYGVVGDVLDRIGWCHAHGRRWFREMIMVGGRRGSKGFLGAVATSYILWNVMATLDPRAHYGIAKGKQLHVLVFAGQHHQAQINQWRDLAQVIQHSACFRRYVAAVSRDTLWLYSPAQLAAGDCAPKDAAFVISAREATELAGRGQTSLAQLFDEMAHMEAAGANRSAGEIYSSASPGTAQFGTDAFLYQASSPWTQQGKFYAQYQRGLAIDPVTRTALDPDMLVVQLPSGDLYRDWERTHDPDFLAWPAGLPFRRLQGPIFDAGEEDRLRRADPDGYDVEFGAQWAATQAAYLQREDVDRLFAPYRGSALPMATGGSPEYSYIAHADPSSPAPTSRSSSPTPRPTMTGNGM
jgi:Tfp pilus assembly protein PilV